MTVIRSATSCLLLALLASNAYANELWDKAKKSADAKYGVILSVPAVSDAEYCAGPLAIVRNQLATQGRPASDADRFLGIIQSTPPEQKAQLAYVRAPMVAESPIANLAVCVMSKHLMNGLDKTGVHASTYGYIHGPGQKVSGAGVTEGLGTGRILLIPEENHRAWEAHLEREFDALGQAETSVAATPKTSSTSSPVGLDQAQIAACTKEIMAIQVASQSWAGTPDEIAVRLGRFQKEMFEGRCAGHPEADAYLAGANKMLAYGDDAESTLGNSASSATDAQSARRESGRSHVPEAVATSCLKPKPEGGVVNACDFAIEYVYCVYRPKANSWSSGFDCEKGQSGTWKVGPLSTSIMQNGGDELNYFGCKYGPTLGKPDGISPAGFQYHSRGKTTARCSEWGAAR